MNLFRAGGPIYLTFFIRKLGESLVFYAATPVIWVKISVEKIQNAVLYHHLHLRSFGYFEKAELFDFDTFLKKLFFHTLA